MKLKKLEKPENAGNLEEESNMQATQSSTREKYTDISGSDRNGNSKELDLEEILENDESSDDDIIIEVPDTKKHFSCQQTIIKTVITTVSLWPKLSAPAILALTVSALATLAPLLCQKTSVISDLTDGLEQALLVKNDQKRAYDIEIEEIKQFDIHERLNVKKKQINLVSRQIEMEKRVEIRKLALEKQKLVLQESQMSSVGNFFDVESIKGLNFGNWLGLIIIKVLPVITISSSFWLVFLLSK